jgi:hypothetical protein
MPQFKTEVEAAAIVITVEAECMIGKGITTFWNR